jgi:aspartyl-tRNA(Asn)/glutamyl-tRNA(Gln) amidotransferase subunit C
MKISGKDIRHIADLARLQVGPEEADSLGKDLNGILEHFERLKNLDLSGIDPFAREDLAATPWREDIVKSWDGREEALSQAPIRDGDFFRVPRILEEDYE